jgi:hypothetical protein
MQFKEHLAHKVMAGEKTQTRRLAKEGESITVLRRGQFVRLYEDFPDHLRERDFIDAVHHPSGLVKWAVYDNAGRTYAVQPGRGRKQIGRVKILAIGYEEDVVNISEEDALAEGFATQAEFIAAWRQMHGDNWGPVFALTLEMADES